ncbi:helix-turn-helix domain-containing protein [Propionivibrio sp.]|uniref:helix-turn-helix domain-containing protein n=1 Tax=Propionivibrio sp. TaxID=2212460 RepID=UPI003BF277B5
MKDEFMPLNTCSAIETLPDVGHRFRQLREKAGKTQSEVAGAVGMRQEAISRFESGRGADFSLTKLLRLLQVLGMELDFVSATRRPTLSSILEERRHNANVGPDSR